MIDYLSFYTCNHHRLLYFAFLNKTIPNLHRVTLPWDGFLPPMPCTRRRTTSRPSTRLCFPIHETRSHSPAQLIQQSYDPVSAHRLSPDDQRRLQSELFELQRRWEAWGLVVPFLFEYADPNVQFFGAHTAQVKISRDWCATQLPACERFSPPTVASPF